MSNKAENLTDNKKVNKKKIAIIISAAVLAVAIIVAAIVLIINHFKDEPALMKCEDQRIELWFYEFLLSRTKGELESMKYRDDGNDFKFDTDEYWTSQYGNTGKTFEEYYSDKTLENCKIYLAALVLYDELVKNGELSEMPQSYYDEIDVTVQDNIDLGYVADGSTEKMNSILSEYGVDVESWREAMVIIAKAEYVKAYLYGGDGASKIGDEVKQEYYEENYYRIKHILVGNFYYEYICDKFGNKIYFDNDIPMYDTENGEVRYDEDGNYIRDEYGEKVMFNKVTGEYLYDTVNGQTEFVKDENGEAKKFFYTDEQMAQRKTEALNICGISKGDFASFEKKGMDSTLNTDYSESFGSSGIYLSELEKSNYTNPAIGEMLGKLKSMDVGEIAMVEDGDGYHVFMKYELDDGAYSDTANSNWFRNFNASLATKMLLEKCRAMFDKIEIDLDILNGAKSIREIGANSDY